MRTWNDGTALAVRIRRPVLRALGHVGGEYADSAIGHLGQRPVITLHEEHRSEVRVPLARTTT